MNIDDLFYLDVAYEDNPSEYKNRPVLLLEEDEYNILLLISTTSQPRKHPMKWYDKYKIPIHNWRKAGLTKASWCLGANLIRVSRKEIEAIFSKEDFIGTIHPKDFCFIVDELERLYSR